MDKKEARAVLGALVAALDLALEAEALEAEARQKTAGHQAELDGMDAEFQRLRRAIESNVVARDELAVELKGLKEAAAEIQRTSSMEEGKIVNLRDEHARLTAENRTLEGEIAVNRKIVQRT